MGTYCTVKDVRTALTSGAVREYAAELEDWQIEDAINAAEGVVNTYISIRYTVPVVEIEEDDPDNPGSIIVNEIAPSPIRYWTRDIAAWYCTLTHRMSKDISEDDPIRLRRNEIIDMLTAVRDRKSNLPLPTVPTDESGKDGLEVFNLYQGTLFGPEDQGLTADYGHTQHFIRSARWGGNA